MMEFPKVDPAKIALLESRFTGPIITEEDNSSPNVIDFTAENTILDNSKSPSSGQNNKNNEKNSKNSSNSNSLPGKTETAKNDGNLTRYASWGGKSNEINSFRGNSESNENASKAKAANKRQRTDMNKCPSSANVSGSLLDYFTVDKMKENNNSSQSVNENNFLENIPEKNSSDHSQGKSIPNVELLIDLQNENKNLKIKLEEKSILEEAQKNQIVSLKLQLKAAIEMSNKFSNETEKKAIKSREVIQKMVKNLAIREAQEERTCYLTNSLSIGKIVSEKSLQTQKFYNSFYNSTEIWEDGPKIRELKVKQVKLLKRKEEIEKRKKIIHKELKKAEKESVLNESNDKMGESQTSFSEKGEKIANFDQLELEESLKWHQMAIKREELALEEEKRQAEAQKIKQISLWRRISLEDKSRFKNRPILNDRYFFVNLLGKGGFSEVWRAFDLKEINYVAVKVHELSSTWSEERKAHYTRHAQREYEIHRDLDHPRIVRLLDVFEIDSHTMATVQELCSEQGTGCGHDLDQYLKSRGSLPEKEAKCILFQLLSGLRYLHSAKGNKPAIIHYDLKPANCLFDSTGNVKITDFGLSKIVNEEQMIGGVELTSQGAGTLRYLPPECFLKGKTLPKITGKVDVWSVGVIFYKMLYGAHPYKEEPDALGMHNSTLNFPSKPNVSNEAKDFIRLSLTHNQDERPDIKKLCLHCYISEKK